MLKMIDDRELAIGRVYARALLGLAEKAGAADAVGEDLKALAEALETTGGVGSYFGSPLVDVSQRAEAIDHMFRGKLHDLLVDTLQVMNKKGRLGQVLALAEAYRQELDEARGLVLATVSTAVPLTPALREKVIAAILQVVRSEGSDARGVDLTEDVDPSLIGGMVVHLGDRKIDSSVARRLGRIGERLADRSSHEVIHHQGYVAAEESA